MRITQNQHIAAACGISPEQQRRLAKAKAAEVEAEIQAQIREANREEAARALREAQTHAGKAQGHTVERVAAALKAKVSRKRTAKAKHSMHLEGMR